MRAIATTLAFMALTGSSVLSARATLLSEGNFEPGPAVLLNPPYTVGLSWGVSPLAAWAANDLVPAFGGAAPSVNGQFHGPPGFYGGEPAATGAGTAMLGIERTHNTVNGAKQNAGPMTAGMRYTLTADLYGNDTFPSAYQLSLANSSGTVLASLTDLDVPIALNQDQTLVFFFYDAGPADDGVDLWVVLGNRDNGANPITRTGIDNVVVTRTATPVPTTFAEVTDIFLVDTPAAHFNTEPGINYKLQVLAEGTTDGWMDAGAFLTGTGETMLLHDPHGYSASRTYRVVSTGPAGPPAPRPSVLICSPQGTSGPHVDLQWLKDLHAAGFEPDYLDHHQDFSWSRISQYNVLVIYGCPAPDASDSFQFPHQGPRLAEYNSLVEDFLDAGGGVFMMVHTDNGDAHVRTLTEPWGARLPIEWFVESDPAKIEPLPRMRGPFESLVLVDQVAASPISTGSEKLWFPYGSHYNASWTGPIDVDTNWQVVVKGSATSSTDPIDQALPPFPLPPDPLIRPGGVLEPDLLALRQYGNGRIVFCTQAPYFSVGQGTQWLYNRHCLSRGFNGIPSDFEVLIFNALDWLGEPSFTSGSVGGYIADPARFDPPNLSPDVFADFEAHVWQDNELDMSQPSGGGNLYRGLIGARTALTGGSGTVLDYANAARAAGLDFVVFLEQFDMLSPAGLTGLGNDCATHSDGSLLLLPGYTIDSNIGNHLFFTGHNLPWPTPITLTGPGDTLLNIQYQDTQGVYGVNSAALNWIMSHDVYAQGQMIGYFNFDDPSAMQLPDLKACSAGAVRFYDQGTFVEDLTQGFIDSAEGTITQLPVSVNIVHSPSQLTQEAQSGNALTYAHGNSLTTLATDALRWNSQYDALNVYASDGPVIEKWTQAYRAFTYGEEPFVINKDLMPADLHVTATTGLQEIRVLNGNRLVRRFLPGGAASFRQILQFPGGVQQNLVLEVEDLQGGKAVGYPLRCWKDGSMSIVYCGDHVNDCRRQYLARGIGIFLTHRFPLFHAGLSWDGGPMGVRPILHFDQNHPRLRSNLGEEGDNAFHNIPILEFNDEQAVVVRSPLREVYDPMIPAANAWHTWGPKDPSTQLTAVRRYTEFNRPLIGVRGTGWAAQGERSGAAAANFESDITFLQNLTINELRLLRTIWYAPRTGTLVIGRTTPVEWSMSGVSGEIVERVDTGEWFGFYSSESYNNVLFVNRGEPVFVRINFDPFGNYYVWVEADLAGLAVNANDMHHYELFSVNEPLDAESGLERFERILDYLAQPEGMQVLQGVRLPGDEFFDVQADAVDYQVELQVPAPTNAIGITIPVRIHGLNPNWSAGLYQIKGHTTGYYTDGEEEYTSLGFDFDGRVYAALFPDQVPLTHVVVGHPIVCDEPDLVLEVMPRADALGNYTWHVAVNNPADNEITATLQQAMTLRGLNFATQQHTIPAGGYLVLQL